MSLGHPDGQPTTQLVINTPGFMALRANHMQSAQLFYPLHVLHVLQNSYIGS